MGSAQVAYGIVYKAAREGNAKEYFEEVYQRMVPHARMGNTVQFMDYIDRRREMYLHYGWEPEHAETNAVLDGIEELVNALANERAFRMTSN